MANNPKRIQDPTEAAMSAIQEALNLREEPPAPPPPPRPAASEPSPTAPVPDPFAHMTAGVEAERPTRRRPTRSTPAIDEDLFLQDTREPGAAREPYGRGPTPADLEEVKP